MKTTKEHFRKFVEYFDANIKEFGLTEWSVSYFHEELPNHAAMTTAQHEARMAAITLSTDIGAEPVTHVALRRLAYHEACELMLAEYFDLINRRGTLSSEDLESLTKQLNHKVIHRLIFRYHKSPAESVSFSVYRPETPEYEMTPAFTDSEKTDSENS